MPQVEFETIIAFSCLAINTVHISDSVIYYSHFLNIIMLYFCLFHVLYAFVSKRPVPTLNGDAFDFCHGSSFESLSVPWLR